MCYHTLLLFSFSLLFCVFVCLFVCLFFVCLFVCLFLLDTFRRSNFQGVNLLPTIYLALAAPIFYTFRRPCFAHNSWRDMIRKYAYLPWTQSVKNYSCSFKCNLRPILSVVGDQLQEWHRMVETLFEHPFYCLYRGTSIFTIGNVH